MPPISRILLSLIIPALLAACGDTLSFLKVDTGPPLQIAVVGPMHGTYAALGGEMRAGVQQAIEDTNEAGGVLNHVLTLRTVDDPCDPKRAAGIAAGLAAEKFALVVGHFCSPSSIAAAPVYGAADILMITPSSSSSALTDEAAERGNTTIFRTVPRDDMQGPALVKYILAHYPNAPVALVSDGTAYGATLVSSTRKALTDAGTRAAREDTIATGASDMAGLVSRLKTARVGVIVFGGYAERAARFLLEVRKQGLAAAFGGGDALIASDFAKIAGPAADGTFVTSLPDMREATTSSEQSRAGKNPVAGLARYGVDAKGYTLFAYAAVELFVEAAKRADSVDAVAVAKALRDGDYKSAIGPMTFDAKGDPTTLHYDVYVWQGGIVRKL
ncbi:MAG: branched-chain amino acid ABC transporter substrate-binding protein [Alphaproteobacteria bacterium]